MNILHVIVELSKAAGTSVFCGEIANGLVAVGHGETIAVARLDKNDIYPLDSRVRLISIDSVLSDVHMKDWSLVHIHGLWTPVLHKVAKWVCRNGIPLVWSPHGMLTPWAFRFKWWKKMPAWWLYQKRDLAKADLLHATAQSEAAGFRRVGLSNKIIIVPLGVTTGKALSVEYSSRRGRVTL